MWDRPFLLAKASSLSFATASKAIEKLSALGIARELTGQRRNRLFVYSAYLYLLTNEETPTATVEAEGRAPGDMKTARELTNFSK
jgi:hypothetical protein